MNADLNCLNEKNEVDSTCILFFNVNIEGPNPQDAHVSIAMMEEPPTASSMGKPKKGRGRDDGNESDSSDSDSDAPTVQHFNVSVSITMS